MVIFPEILPTILPIKYGAVILPVELIGFNTLKELSVIVANKLFAVVNCILPEGVTLTIPLPA